MNLLHNRHIVFRYTQGGGRITNEEGILSITSRMTLGLEQSIKVPEGGLYELVGWHLLEAHLQQDLTEFGSNHQQRMQITALRLLSQGTEIVSTMNEKRKTNGFRTISSPLSNISFVMSATCLWRSKANFSPFETL